MVSPVRRRTEIGKISIYKTGNYTEPTHDVVATGSTVHTDGARDTAVSAAEGRLIVDAVDKIFLLEPNKHPLVTLLTNVN